MRAWLTSLLCLWLGACGWLSPAPPPPPPVKAADLLEVGGSVTVERADAGTAPATPGPLYLNDVVATGAASRALLTTPRARLELGEQTRFKVGSGGPSRLELSQGELTFLGGDGEVDTPLGRAVFAGEARGTLQIDGAEGGLTLTQGEITFIDDDGKVTSTKAGQRLQLKQGEVTLIEEDAPDAGTSAGELSVRFRRDRGAPLLRAPGERTFKKVLDAGVLVEGTAFSLPRGTAATLTTPGIALRLDQGASGTFTGVSRQADGVSLEVALGAGTATTLIDQGGTLVTATRVRATSDATVGLARTKTGSTLDVLAGEVEVTSGAKKVTAATGQRIVTTAKSAVVQPRPRPALLLPVARKLRVHGTQPEVTLTLPDDAARVEVARDAAFTDLVLAGAVKGAVQVPTTGREVLYVRALDAQRATKHEGTLQFRPDRSMPKSADDSETISETGQRATLFFQGDVPALTFTFTAQEGTARYRLKILKAKNNEQVLVREVTEPRCTLEKKALEEGEYVWYAAPLAADGSEQGSGALNRFELRFDNALTTLTITRPLPGEVASAKTVASGVAPLKARLFINGRRATLDGQGRFSEPVGAVDTVIFRLVGADNEAFWVRRLKRR